MHDQITPISVRGRYLWCNEERFIIKGVVYQNNYIRALKTAKVREERQKDNKAAPLSDPIADDQLEVLSCSIPLLQELGVNTLLVYSIDNTKSHDLAMDMLAKAGIYVIAVSLPSLACPPPEKRQPRRPLDSYTPDLVQHYFATVDRMAAYPNTLGVVAANEVLLHAGHTAGAGVIRALVRDVKRYMALHAEVNPESRQRVLPVGVSSNGVSSIFYDEFRAAAKWASPYFPISYDVIQVQSFENAHVPLFFSEYGTTSGETSPRQFLETTAIYSPAMTRIFSGACAYEFFEGPNRYGLVVVRADGTLERLRAYENLKARLAECSQSQSEGRGSGHLARVGRYGW
ncbi:hypothetical protein PG997_013575 [Apiospora hydei]|uniref:1,3-beta-glucanosyltransferase n=1 Tax=Apiospora hydei TaxID=1337664 RepID=A0ABR1VA39_9PEZI